MTESDTPALDWRDANWRDPGQWWHAIKFIACRMVYGRHCPHVRPFWK